MERTIRNKVEFENRPARDIPCAIIFALMFAANLVCGIVVFAMKNVSIPKLMSTENGNSTKVRIEIGDSLQKDIDECNSRKGGRMLAQTYHEQESEIWTVFQEAPQIPAVIVVFIVFIGVVWIALLQYCAKPIVWATAIIKIAATAAVGVWMVKLEATTVGIFCFIGAGALLVFTIVVRDKINKAAEHLEVAIIALRAEPSVFLASGILKTIYLVYLAYYCVVVINSYFIFEVDPVTCNAVPVSWAHSMITFVTFCMVWTTYWVAAAKTHITAVSVACWYFDQKEGDENRPKYPAFAALKHVFTTSAGTIALGSVICTIVERIISAARSKLWWTSPVGCLLKCIMLAFQTLIQTLTKFTIIVHAINGHDFFGSAKVCFGILKRHFVGAIVTDQVGTQVLRLGAYAFSIAVGFAAWGWTDDVKNWDTLTSSGWEDSGYTFLFYVFLVLYVYLTMYPLPTIFGVALLSQYITGQYSAPLVGVFCAAVAHILLTYIADVVLNAMDTVFLCYAIGKDNNHVVEGRESMYKLLQEMPEVMEAKVLVGGSAPQYVGPGSVPVAQAYPVSGSSAV